MKGLSVFILSLVKLQEICSSMEETEKDDFIAELQAACSCDCVGVDIKGLDFHPFVFQLRSSEPFISLSYETEQLVYTTFRSFLSL